MIEATLDITTRDGAMETFVCRPDRGSHPAVLLLMDAPGIREELRDMTRRLATVGYCVLLPNLYYRAGRDAMFDPSTVLEHGSPDHTRMRAIRTKMTIPPVMDDVAAMMKFLETQEGVKPGPIGVHGYCMSGPYALAAAARYPDRVAAAASFYGTWLVSDAVESPHLSLRKAKGELYISCAEFDELAPLPMVAELKLLFNASDNPGELEIYPGVHHGFGFPQRKIYEKHAAERHWERLISLYRRRLG
jgi:carboxymethylenebutenolidase